MHAESDFFLAVAGAIPLLLLVLLVENKLKFEKETDLGRGVWLVMLLAATFGEIAALRVLAWGTGSTIWFLVAAVGLVSCLTMVVVLFVWQLLKELAPSGEESIEHYDLCVGAAVTVVAVGGLAILLLPPH